MNETNTHQLALSGVSLSPDQIASLEKRLLNDPTDISARIQLLGKYFLNRFTSSEVAAARMKHITWIVENSPEEPIAGLPFADITEHEQGSEEYSKIRALWLSQIDLHKENVAVLENASNFFIEDDKELAEKCLLSCKSLDPSNLEWSAKLAFLYQLWGPERAQDALAQTEYLATQVHDEQTLFHVLTDMPARALEVGEIEKAREAANKLLELADDFREDWNFGNAIQQGHTALGRIALSDGDNEKAKLHLLQSALSAASCQTRSFGPTMSLADELLKRGETEIVLKYLDRCKSICGPLHHKLIDMRVKLRLLSVQPDEDAHKQQLSVEKTARAIELEQLQSEPAATRLEFIQDCIKQTESTTELWRAKRRTVDDSKLSAHIDSLIEISVEHRRNLQALLEQCE